MAKRFDYGRMAGTAGRLLDRFNQGVITLTRPGTTTPGQNPWDPPAVADPVVHTLKATARGVSKEFVDGTTILATDIEVTAADFGDEPDLADEVALDGKAVTLIKAIRLPAAGPLVAWKLIVRG